MTIKIEQAEGRVPQDELDFFLKGKEFASFPSPRPQPTPLTQVSVFVSTNDGGRNAPENSGSSSPPLSGLPADRPGLGSGSGLTRATGLSLRREAPLHGCLASQLVTWEPACPPLPGPLPGGSPGVRSRPSTELPAPVDSHIHVGATVPGPAGDCFPWDREHLLGEKQTEKALRLVA